MSAWLLPICALAAALAASRLTGAVRRYALSRAVLDAPNARSLHTEPTPRGGGLAIAAVVLAVQAVALALGWIEPIPGLAWGLGAAALACLGWRDDREPLGSLLRLGVQFLVATVAVTVLFNAHAGAGTVGVAPLVAAVVVGCVWMVNLYNFMDGSDGIAGTQAVTAGAGGAILALIDKSPLGSAAGFGTSIPVDREFTAKEMGFAGVQVNSLYCQNSRGKFESAYLEALAQVMLTLGKFANDMVLFTSQEFDYFAVDETLTTGSSIMPHKHNLDVMEILRGNVSVVIANQLMVKDIAKNLISGYNRDGQLIKKPLIESTHTALGSIEVVGVLLAGLTPKQESMRAKINAGIFTADIANALVQEKGVPFRDAYTEAAGMTPKDVDFSKNLASKKSLGAPGNLALAEYRKRIKKAL